MEDKYRFMTRLESLDCSDFPATTKMTVYLEHLVSVDCVNNFNEDERDVIDSFGINDITDLIRHDGISEFDKEQGCRCFDLVCDLYELAGIERSEKCMIQFERYCILIHILSDGCIKYCKFIGTVQ